MKKIKQNKHLKTVIRNSNHSLVLFCLLATSCLSQRNVFGSNNKDFKGTYCYNLKSFNSDEILRILSDSVLFKTKIKSDKCFRLIINELANKSGIEPSWNCDLGGCNYLSYSLDRSIYKLDLVKWMRFFKYSDTTRMFLSSKNYFSRNEVKYIKMINQFQPGRIDTMILYSKE